MLIDRIATRAAAYGMEGRTVDGNDVEAVLAAATEAVEQVRRTRKPFLLETYTYRQRGHFEPDDQSYVDKAELAAWTAKDPIAVTSKRLLEQGVVTAAQLEAMRASAQEAIARAAQFAAESPFPSVEELLTDVYA